MSQTDKYTTETITDVRPWTPSLFSFRTTRDRGYRFTPGQFARIGVKPVEGGEIIWRAYSIASASYDEHLEFFSVVVEEFFETPATLERLHPKLYAELSTFFRFDPAQRQRDADAEGRAPSPGQ